jgi:hypothetical protein
MLLDESNFTSEIYISCVLIFSQFVKGKISCDRSRLRNRDAEDNVEEEIKSEKTGNEDKELKGPSK